MQWASLSPDGATVAGDRRDSTRLRDIWLYDLARGTPTRFTFGPSSSERPVWSPDGSLIVFMRPSAGVYRKASNTIGQEEALDKDSSNHWITDWSRDGRYLIEEVLDPKTRNDIWVIPQQGEKKPFAFLNTEHEEGKGRLSPNGQWLAYYSNESRG